MTLISRTGAWAGIFLIAACGQSAPPNVVGDTTEVLSATETSQDLGDYVVHFNALPTDQLSAPIASQYGIVRSANQALLTVSLRKKQADQTDISARGAIDVSATNLTGQLKNMTLREIVEGDAVYYVGVVSITNAETLIFSIQITPEGEPDTHSIRYMKQFYID